MTATAAMAGTLVPRWTASGARRAAGWGRREVAVPGDLVEVLGRVAATAAADVPSLLVAAYLKALAAVCGEETVRAGLRTGGSPARWCQLALAGGSWLELAAAAHRAAREAGDAAAAGAAEAVLDLSGVAGKRPAAPPDGAAAQVLWCSYAPGPGAGLRLAVRYRRDAVDAGFAERFAGYQLTALERMVAGPAAPHHARTLVSGAELRVQLHDLAGPREPLGDRLFVELFEEQVRRRPGELAAVHGEARWSYAELGAQANRFAHALLDAGLQREGVVAVVMERNLDWLAAALGVLKAGGTYLPVRPDFPADRVAAQLARSDCRLAVTEPSSEAVLRAAARVDRPTTVVRTTEIASARTDDPGVRLEKDQLAYIYFTSGSTGAPKGAMCEHAGMLNHLLAKVTDLGLTEGDAVTQTASQCFDISLWQFAAPLLAGGRTVIVDTADQLDVAWFADLLAGGGVDVVQVVPSYLDVLLSHLEQRPQPLGDLRAVSVTGEALKLELVRRWLRCYPGIPLVNAYGATEVSDDTMHERLDRLPGRDFVSVGRSLRNVNTYVLDRHGQLAPLGAPGEIAFSGVCVGRGYVNDPERTREAFGTDPYRPGTRLYRTGDFGRWLPEGTIEFLGRRDEQMKVRGYRIEIGEIENRLVQVPGVAEAAVVVAGQGDGASNLAAFHTGAELEAADLRDLLAAALPDYMIPAYFRHLDALPLTENRKTDKRRLAELATEMARDTAAYVPPATATERRLATAWSEVLGVLVGQIGRDDDFFRLGGTSLAAVRLVVRLDRAVSLRDLAANPVLSDLAALLDARDGGTAAAEPGAGPGGGMLQRLSTWDGEPGATLVCFPYASGNAVNYQLVSRALGAFAVDVHAVELPGHDVARPGEPFRGVEEVAAGVRTELPATGAPVLLWGQGTGAAYTLELARLLEAGGWPPLRVFLGGALLRPPEELEAAARQAEALSDRDITRRLHTDRAYVEFDLLKAERARLVGLAYRHDVGSASRYLAAAQRDAHRPRLATPVEVVVAADDPSTAGYHERYRLWERLATTVALREVAAGGHYLPRTAPEAVAGAVAAAAGAPVPA